MKLEHAVLLVFAMSVFQLSIVLSISNRQLEQTKEITKIEKVVLIENHVVEKTRKEPEDIFEEDEEEIIEEVEEKILPTLMLSAKLGTVQGPQEIEKYYNLPMDKVVQNMRKKGYTEEDYPYYVTDNGIKMFGDFIMVAADLNEYPRGTIVETSLGQGIVCDECETPDVIDLAVEW